MTFRILAASISLVAAVGCGDRFEFAEVEGMVTLKGKPLEKVRVEFSPLTDGPQSAAMTDEQGRFSLSTVDGSRKGAVVGMHRVVLRDLSIVSVPFRGRENADVDMTAGKKPRISTAYSNVTTTPLEVEVGGETKDLSLDVQPYRR